MSATAWVMMTIYVVIWMVNMAGWVATADPSMPPRVALTSIATGGLIGLTLAPPACPS